MPLNGYPEKHCHLIANQKTAKTWKDQNFLCHMKKEYPNNLNMLLMNMV